MNEQQTERMRKIIFLDGAGGELQLEAGERQSLSRLEDSYRGLTGHRSGELLLADHNSRRVLGDKSRTIGDVWPGLGQIVILVLPDTVNAGHYTASRKNAPCDAVYV